MAWVLLVVVVALLCLGSLPNWPYTSGYHYGYYPSGLLGIVFLILILLLISGRL